MYIPPDEVEYFAFMFLVVGCWLLVASATFIILLIINLYGWIRRRLYGYNRSITR